MKKIKSLPIWLLWKKETRDGKATKIPYKSPKIYASSTDSATWNTYDFLKKTYFKSKKTDGEKGIGIVFEDTGNIIGIDFDHCVENGKLHNDVEKLVKQAKTYVEYSPSGTGIHLLFQKSEKIELLANKHHFDTYAIEIYASGRYFTFTENEHELSEELRVISQDELTTLLASLGYPWSKIEKPIIHNVELTIDDNTLIEKMFSSKHGKLIENVWKGDIADCNNDASKADHKLCMHLAFWSGKNYQQIERLWLSSPLGQRLKTQKRNDYRTRTIINAISSTQDVYTPTRTVSSTVTHEADGQSIDFDFILSGGKDPVPLLIFPNILRVLRHDPYFIQKLRKNDFSHFTEFKNERGKWESLNDDFISLVREYITENFPPFVRLSKDMTTDAILRASLDTRVNPPRDYFISLVWDNTPRLNSWLHHTYGTPDDELHQAIGSNWMKGLVKRVIQPGCQFDEVLALESPQGYRKSSSLRMLGTPWHVETTHSIDNKDFYLLLAQNVIVEFSEGEIMDRASVNKLKAEITKTEDQLRPPYERGMVKYSRSCVFAVTTNRLELKDDTGNRRWLPVQLQKIADIEWLKEHKDQLFAEAYHRVIINGETTHEYPDSLSDLQESRQEYSDNDEKIIDLLSVKSIDSLKIDGLSLTMIYENIHGSGVRMDKIEELRISSSLRRLNFVNERHYVDGKRLRRWFPTDKAIKMLKEIKKIEDHDF